MTEQTHTPARSAKQLTLALAAIAGLILALFASPAFADHTGPLVVPDSETYSDPGDNPDCEDVLGTAFDEQEKFDPADSGTQGNVTLTNDDEVISFEAAEGWLVAIAIIKGGNEGANVYDYTGFPGGGVDHDNGLTTPTEQDVSHVTFCLVEAPEETPTPTPEGSEAGGTGTPAPTPTPTPEGSQAGGTGTPVPSLPSTDLSLPGIGGSLATILFGAVLFASLGALAYANVQAVRRRS